MTTTQNTYTGNGSTKNYSFTFEYLSQEDVKASLNGTTTTAFTLANATTVAFTTAPAKGVSIVIFRDTANDDTAATFFAGSAIKAEDLNANFDQILYVSQETDNEVITSNTTAAKAVTTANSAVTTANSAVTTANSAVTTANSAVTTANAADTKSDATVATANTASTNASAAVATANTASTNASAAVVTANAASVAVSNAVLFTLIATVAAIPGSPSDNDYVEIGDSTGIQSFSPLSGLPSGFTGASGLTVRARYDSSASSWVFMNYFANDSEDRYATIDAPTFTGNLTSAGTINGINVGRGAKSIGSNTAVGLDSLISNTTGSYNTGVGRNSLYRNTTGSGNTGLGQGSLLFQHHRKLQHKCLGYVARSITTPPEVVTQGLVLARSFSTPPEAITQVTWS